MKRPTRPTASTTPPAGRTLKPSRLHSNAVVYFDAVRRHGSIREAARQLNMASSAVNRQILKLEQDVGLPLFERLPGGVRLTAAGEAFARHSILVLQDAERFAAEIDQLVGVHAGHVTVAAAEGICTSVMPAVIAALKVRAPRITVSLRRTESLAIAEAVMSGDADLGVGFDLLPPPGLRRVFAAEFTVGAIMKSDHALAGRTVVSLSACLEHPLILPEGMISLNQLLAPAFLRLNVTPVASVSSNSIEAIRAMVEMGLGIGLQTNFGLDEPLASGRMVHVPIDAGGPIISTVAAFTRGQRALPPPVDLFLQILATELRHRQAIVPVVAAMPKKQRPAR
jgi:DNA-binding transcriptional LysR family regulator